MDKWIANKIKEIERAQAAAKTKKSHKPTLTEQQKLLTEGK